MRYLGEGTSRVAYSLGEGLVKKVHLSEIGWRQSQKEYEIYTEVPQRWKHLFNPIYEVNEEYQICRYSEPHTGDSDIPYDVLMVDDLDCIPFRYYVDADGCWGVVEDEHDLLRWLRDRDIVTNELFGTSNFSVIDENLVFIDYGMTNRDMDVLIELQNSGVAPSYIEDWCTNCCQDTRIQVFGDTYTCKVCGFTKQ